MASMILNVAGATANEYINAMRRWLQFGAVDPSQAAHLEDRYPATWNAETKTLTIDQTEYPEDDGTQLQAVTVYFTGRARRGRRAFFEWWRASGRASLMAYIRQTHNAQIIDDDDGVLAITINVRTP